MQKPTATTVYVVTRHREYEGSDVVAMYAGPGAEAAARRRAYDENQVVSPSDTHSVLLWSGAGELTSDYRNRWTAPKAPTEPAEPREYAEAKRRYVEQQAAYEAASEEFA